MRAGSPGRIAGASTSSIGALIYKQDASIRSTVGGVGMPTGDGVTNSPSSPLISAMTPSNGANNCVRSSCAWMTSTLAAVTRAVSCAAVHAAAVDSARPVAWSAASSDARFCSNRAIKRSASRSATSAMTQDSRERDTAARASRVARSSSALMSSFQSSSNNSPDSTLSPSTTGKLAIWPPIAGDRPARRQASTVPARVLATVAATGPCSTVVNPTSIGSGSVYHQRPTPKAAMTAIVITTRCIRRIVLGPSPRLAQESARYRSASSAAMQPAPADVTAWR